MGASLRRSWRNAPRENTSKPNRANKTSVQESIESVCVFCGASAGRRAEYGEMAAAMGREIARRSLRLVFGGGCVGLMGIVADAALAEGGTVIGVIPRVLLEKELGHPRVTELHIVDSMHERKAMMAELSDAFIALPGGIGTLEEFCEIFTWAQLGLHTKPFGILNVCGYYDGLITLFEHAVGEGFLQQQHVDMIAACTHPAELLDRLAVSRPRPQVRWIAREDT